MMLFKLLTRIDRDKFSPTVISVIEGGVFVNRIKALNIAVFSLGFQHGIPNPFGILRLKKILNKIKPDLIQGWMYHGNLFSFIGNFFENRKVPILWSIHHTVDTLKNEKISLAAVIKITAMLSKKANTIIFSSKIGEVQHLRLGYSQSNSITIIDSFDLTIYNRPLNSKLNLRNFFNISKNSVLIGSLARFHPMKDHFNLINAASDLVKDYNELHFVLAGPNIDYNNSRLNRRIRQLGISDRIHLLGEIENVPSFMESLDIFTSSSAYGESFPNVIGEAMSGGVPCVVTDVGDSRLIVGNTGIVIPPADLGALIDAWKKFLVLGANGRKNLGEKARIRIEENFNIDGPNSFVKKYEKLYMEVSPSLF